VSDDRTENWCVHRVRDYSFCVECHDAALIARILAAIEALPDASVDVTAMFGLAVVDRGSAVLPGGVDRAAVIAIVKGEK